MKTSTIAWFGVGILMAGIIGLAINLADTEPRTTTSPLIGNAAPAIELPALDGSGTVRLAEYDGQIVIVNFFASWCLQCIAEHPDLLASANSLADEVQFLGVSYLDSVDNANAFLDEHGRATSAEYLFDEAGFSAIEYGLFGVPETFFINDEGTIVAKITGPANLALILDVVADIKAGNATGLTQTGEPQGSPSG